MVVALVGALIGVAALAGAGLHNVKPQDALGNLAADDRAVANAMVAAVAVLPGGLAILAISGTELEIAARATCIAVFSEGFADRTYPANRRMVPL